jgi:hypothetical protein
MKFFTTIEGWFKKEKTQLEKLFQRIEPLIAKAEPIVKEVATVAAAAASAEAVGAPAAILTAVADYLNKTVAVSSVVDGFLKANETAPVNNLLHNTAALALQFTPGVGATDLSDVDTAVQLAYSAVKEQKAASVPPVASAVAPAPAK